VLADEGQGSLADVDRDYQVETESRTRLTRRIL